MKLNEDFIHICILESAETACRFFFCNALTTMPAFVLHALRHQRPALRGAGDPSTH